MLMDLTEKIENHCKKCKDRKPYNCNICFFDSVDFGKLNLGSKRTYRRAYYYLNITRIVGFQRTETFGTHLKVPERKVVTNDSRRC